MAKLYQTKLVVIKKEMLQLHDRATKLKVSICLRPSLINLLHGIEVWICGVLLILPIHLDDSGQSRDRNPVGGGGRREFLLPSRLALGPTQPPTQWVPGLSPRGKAGGACCWPPTPSSTKVKDRVELYLPLWAFVACYRVNFTFTCTFTLMTVQQSSKT